MEILTTDSSVLKGKYLRIKIDPAKDKIKADIAELNDRLSRLRSK